jgi:hypothetical protein
MFNIALALIGVLLIPSMAIGCGLDWTLPTNHFDGVEEHGYVSVWEKIGEADLGDGLVIPVNINFNSHREASSPTLGKGWEVALLESHVEPLDENSMKVIMPDGWNFYFYRNGNTENWRGNAGWVGETKDALFTITAPCGWKIRFDGGKIQEIDSNKNRALSYKYNGDMVTEVNEGGKPFVALDFNTNTGIPTDLIIGGRKIDIHLAQRPRIFKQMNQNLVTGFDQSLSQLIWQNGTSESFTFGTSEKGIDPNLAINLANQSRRNFTWDATTREIKTDGEWEYSFDLSDSNAAIKRTNLLGQIEYYSNNARTGIEIEQGINGIRIVKTRFASGMLRGAIRKIEVVEGNNTTLVYQAAYDEKGYLLRQISQTEIYNYTDNGLISVKKNGLLLHTLNYIQ